MVSMKVYIVAITDSTYMFPVCDGKFFKMKSAAQKACDRYNGTHPNGAKVLVADNWHLEDDE